MLVDGITHWIAIPAHGIISESFALPGLHRLAASLQTKASAYDGKQNYFFYDSTHRLFLQKGFNLLLILLPGIRAMKATMDKPHFAGVIQHK